MYQIEALREQRGWSQAQFGKEAGKPQSAIARAESPEYGRWNIGTLIDFANAFDVALEVRFVDWPTFIRWTARAGSELEVPSFSLEGFVGTDSSDLEHRPIVLLGKTFDGDYIRFDDDTVEDTKEPPFNMPFALLQNARATSIVTLYDG